MGTRAKIKIVHSDNTICSKYYNMDGHVPNWGAQLIAALSQTTPEVILKNRQLFKFMLDGYESDNGLDYLCVVSLEDEGYRITITTYGGDCIFDGSLEEFSGQYDLL